MDETFWEVLSAAIEQSRRKANMVAQGDGKFGPPKSDPQIPEFLQIIKECPYVSIKNLPPFFFFFFQKGDACR